MLTHLITKTFQKALCEKYRLEGIVCGLSILASFSAKRTGLLKNLSPTSHDLTPLQLETKKQVLI